MYTYKIDGKNCLGINATAIKTGILDAIDIYGSRIYAKTSQSANYAMMDGDGFKIYKSGIDTPKFQASVNSSGSGITVYLGSGDGSGDGRMAISKGLSFGRMVYYTGVYREGSQQYGDSWCGFQFNQDGTIKVYGTLQGVNAVWAD